MIAACGNRGNIIIWSAKSYERLADLKTGNREEIISIAFNPEGTLIAGGGKDKNVYVWNVKNKKLGSTFKGHRGAIASVAFSPNGKMIASADDEAFVHMWQVKQQIIKSQSQITADKIVNLPVSADKNSKKPMTFQTMINLWNEERYSAIVELKRNSNHREAENIYSDYASHIKARFLAANSSLRRYAITLWNIDSGNIVAEHKKHHDMINAICFSHDGQWLASGSYDQTICLWNTNTKKEPIVLKGQGSCIQSLAFSPNDKLLASGCFGLTKWGHTIYLWSMDNYKYKKFAQLTGNGKAVNNLVFSPDNRLLVSVSLDGSMRLWDVESHNCLAKCNLNGKVDAMKFYQNDNILYLCVDFSRSAYCSRSIYCFEIKKLASKLSFILKWATGRNEGLSCDKVDIGGVTGMDALSERLFKQRGAIGILSQRESEKVVKEREALTLYNPHKAPCNVFSQQYMLTPSKAVVSIARKKDGKAKIHTFLTIEQIENGYYTITRADFLLDKEQTHKTIARYLVAGIALVELSTKPLADVQRLANECVYKCWNIKSEQAKQLLKNLEADRLERIAYLNVGNSPIYNVSTLTERGLKNHSCLTWCEEHLMKIDLDVSAQKKWLDVIVAYPEYHLNNEEENRSNCVIS